MENERISAEHEMLADKIRAILYFETSKSISKIDDDLIAECADYLMELENRKPLEENEIRKEINKIFANSIYKNKRGISLRHLLIAAILIAVMLLASLIIPATGDDLIFKFRSSIMERVLELREGESFNIGNMTVKRDFNPFIEYDSVEEFYEAEELDVLYPSALPGNLKLSHVKYIKHKDVVYVTGSGVYSIHAESGEDFSLYVNKEDAEFEIINGLECYYISDPIDNTSIQCAFARNGYTYIIRTYNYDEMVFIINNLKEF